MNPLILAGLGALGVVVFAMTGDDDKPKPAGKAPPKPKPPQPKKPAQPVDPGPPAQGFGGGRAFIASLDEKPTTKREAAIFQAIKDRFINSFTWVPVNCDRNGHTCTVFVTDDAIAVGTDDDFVRVAMTILTAQAVADEFNAFLPTSRIVDQAWLAADAKLTPHTQTPDSKMADTSRFEKHSDAIQAELDALGGGELARTVGKSYIITNDLIGNQPVHGVVLPGAERSAIYGWIKPNGQPIQPATARAHVSTFTDYSQFVTLVHSKAVVDGEEMWLIDLMTDPELATLVSAEGPMQITRHPGVPDLLA